MISSKRPRLNIFPVNKALCILLKTIFFVNKSVNRLSHDVVNGVVDCDVSTDTPPEIYVSFIISRHSDKPSL